MRLKRQAPARDQLPSNGNTALPATQSNLSAPFNNSTSSQLCTVSANDTSSLYNQLINTSTDNYMVNENETFSNSAISKADEQSNIINSCNTFIGSTSRNTSLNKYIETFVDGEVCNEQFKEVTKKTKIAKTINGNNITLAASDLLKLDENEVPFVENQLSPYDEERMLEQSDTDETSESNNVCPVPRGIVNPNYPGFQHLAHTLQDYSKTVDNFYHFDNEMTDDDLDAEGTDLIDDNKDEEDHQQYLNANKINNNEVTSLISDDNHTRIVHVCKNERALDVISDHIKNTIAVDHVPDLLKNVHTNKLLSEYNNSNSTTICNDERNEIDFENIFCVKNIIGDFNKEVEEEINNLYNYSSCIQDDLSYLRRDIEKTLKKPLEDTLNHISSVVNSVIKHLVAEHQVNLERTHTDYSNEKEIKSVTDFSEHASHKFPSEISKTIFQEMKHSRPTFLYIENNLNCKISDALLSDAKDDIVINDSDYEKGDVEITCDVLKSTDKLPPKTSRAALVPSTSQLNIFRKDKNFNEIALVSLSTEKTKIQNKTNISFAFDGAPINTPIQTVENTANEDKKQLVELASTRKKLGTNSCSRKSSERCSDAGSTSKHSNLNSAHGREKSEKNKSVRNKRKAGENVPGSFDVYNIETALPKLDFDAIENHLRAAKEAERKKRNDREEIRRRLAMGADLEDVATHDRSGRKPSLHSRLQSGMNLQICIMNEAVSDSESQVSDSERSPRGPVSSNYVLNHPYKTRPLSTAVLRNDSISQTAAAKIRPGSLALKPSKSRSAHSLGHIPLKESDFHALQATLQTEARIALAQAKELARVHMERERRCRAASPVTEMLRRSLHKASAPLPPDRRRVSRQLLTDMNIAQLQVMVNSLCGEVEQLSEALVRLLMERDELHMGQDSMLVDIEDLTRYLGVKEQGMKKGGAAAAGKGGVRRLTSLVQKK